MTVKRILVAAVGAAGALALWLASPLPLTGLESRADPARSYAEALRRVTAIQADDSPAIALECHTRLLTHGHRTRRVIVLLHGLTNCPAQFDSLGRRAFEDGANVLIPRLPRHGLSQRMTTALARLDAVELRAFVDRVLDAADGLGDSVTVAGLSIGGTLAAWAAQERPDVARAVMIAPMLGVAHARGVWTPVVARMLGVIPNVFVWWDAKRREDLPGPRHVYPRFATRAVTADLRIGWMVREAARRRRCAARSVAMVTVGGDPAVDNAVIAEVADAWRRHGVRAVEAFEFPESLHLNHDIVDLEQVGNRPAVTYPVLARIIER